MHRITKNKTKALRIAVVAVFMAVAAFAAKPAQAESSVVGGYKYVAVDHDLGYAAHVVQLDFLWPLGGYREGGKRPTHAFGFGIAVGGNNLTKVRTPSGEIIDFLGRREDGTLFPIERVATYFSVPLIYEYVFPFGLGISGGVGVSLMVIGDNPEFELFGAIGTGVGLSDLGVNYHFKNGLALYSRVNLGYASFLADDFHSSVGTDGLIWGAGAGVGYWF